METAKKGWDLVVACLSPTKASVELSAEADLHARLLCDGFGKLDRRSDLVYDWSHVRDSSEAALDACAEFLTKYLAMDVLVKKANAALNRGDIARYEQALREIKRFG
jgi:hypothetical protein